MLSGKPGLVHTVNYLEVLENQLGVGVPLVVRKALTSDCHSIIQIPKKVAIARSCRRNNVLIVAAFRPQKNAQVVIEQVPFDRFSVISSDQVHK